MIKTIQLLNEKTFDSKTDTINIDNIIQILQDNNISTKDINHILFYCWRQLEYNEEHSDVWIALTINNWKYSINDWEWLNEYSTYIN